MNIFKLHEDAIISAEMHCDKHVSKLAVESAQMMASAVIRHGATPEQMPLTKAGSPYRGGHPHHPCTRWAGDTRDNYEWLASYGLALCNEYTLRYGKVHACEEPIMILWKLCGLIPEGEMTPFAQAMPDEHKHEDVVKAYRSYYHTKTFAKWEKGRNAPDWWKGVGQ